MLARGSLCLLVLLIVSVGCSNVRYYTPPPELTSETAATLIGSKVETANPLESDIRNYVAQINDDYFRGDRYSWDQPVLVGEGTYRLKIGVWYSDKRGLITVPVPLKAGKTYTVRSEMVGGWEAFVWIEDETGVRVIQKFPVVIGGSTNPVPILIPVK